MRDKSITEFLAKLGSSSATPGGGGAAALTAALSSALGCMVLNLTKNKKFFLEYSAEEQKIIHEHLEQLTTLSRDFAVLIDRDAEVFEQFMASYKLPAVTEEEKSYRHNEIQKGYMEAMEVPLTLAKKAFSSYAFLETTCKLGNKNLISDAGIAVLLIQASIESAVLSVEINLNGIEDEEYKLEIREVCSQMIHEGRKKRDHILEKVVQYMGK